MKLTGVLFNGEHNRFPVDSGGGDSFAPQPAEVVVGKVKAHLSKMSPCGM